MLHGVVEILAGEVPERIRSFDQGEGLVRFYAAGHGHGHKLIGKDRQGIRSSCRVFHYLRLASSGDHHSFQDFVRCGGQDLRPDLPAYAMSCASGTLGHSGDLSWAVVLYDEVCASYVYSELERRCADESFQLLCLECVLGLHPILFGQRSVMDPYGVGLVPHMVSRGQPFGRFPGVDEE